MFAAIRYTDSTNRLLAPSSSYLVVECVCQHVRLSRRYIYRQTG